MPKSHSGSDAGALALGAMGALDSIKRPAWTGPVVAD